MKLNKLFRYLAVFLTIAVALSFMPCSETHAATKVKMSKCTITLSKTQFTYDGKAKCPKVTVTYNGAIVKKSGHYSLRYSGTKEPGTAKIVIRGKGKFKGSVTKKYRIIVGSVSGLRASYNGIVPSSTSSSITLNWNRPPKCKSCKIYVSKNGSSFASGSYTTTKNYFTLTNLKGPGTFSFSVYARAGSKNKSSGPAYITKVVNPSSLATPIASAVSNGYRRIDVSWNYNEDAQGYYVCETNTSTGATNSITINSGSQTSTSFFDKQKGENFKYKVQAFAGSTDGTVMSDWSKTVSATAAGTVIGHAKSGDSAYQLGDQSGNEVSFGNWTYSSTSSSWKHWTYMARFKDPQKAEKCARLMADACNNNNIGYGKSPANLTMTNIAKTNGFNIAGITTKCDTDCVCLVSVCINGSIGKWTVSGLNPKTTMTSKLSGLSNYLTVYSDPKYLTTDAYLQRGDILWTNTGNHTCIVQ